MFAHVSVCSVSDFVSCVLPCPVHAGAKPPAQDAWGDASMHSFNAKFTAGVEFGVSSTESLGFMV